MSLKIVVKIVFYTLLIAIVARVIFIDTFYVKGDSMSPSINDGDYVVVNRMAYAFSEPKRGDIIVVRPRDSLQKILKRIIGLPGERIVFDMDKIIIKKNREDTGEIIQEIYLGKGEVTKNNNESYYEVIDPKEYFVLGDNRSVSIDSRSLGPVDSWSIKGKVIFIF